MGEDEDCDCIRQTAGTDRFHWAAAVAEWRGFTDKLNTHHVCRSNLVGLNIPGEKISNTYYTCVCVCVCVCVHAHVCVSMCVHMQVCVRQCVCMCKCACEHATFLVNFCPSINYHCMSVSASCVCIGYSRCVLVCSCVLAYLSDCLCVLYVYDM